MTKYFVAVPLRTADARETAQALADHLICIYGPPTSILSDQGGNFMSKIMEDLAIIFRIAKYCTTAYRPCSNGSIERLHSSLTEYLKAFTNDYTEWGEVLPYSSVFIQR